MSARQSAVPALMVALALFGTALGVAVARTGFGPLMLELNRLGLVDLQVVVKAFDADAEARARMGKMSPKQRGGC